MIDWLEQPIGLSQNRLQNDASFGKEALNAGGQTQGSRLSVVIRPDLDHAAIFADVPGFCRPIVRWLSKKILPRPSHGICRIKTQIRKNRIHESLPLIAHKQEALARRRL